MAVICFLVVTFVLPGILGEGDVRGGEGVNSALQVKFILQNPIEYMTIVFRFLKDYYLAFQISWKSIFTTLGYLGSTECHVYAFILLVVVCVTDKGSTDQWKGYGKVRGVNLLLSMLTICLIVTALYISFTPVGNASIGGCQPRYLIPLLYGFCATIGSCKIENKMNKTYYNLGIITVMSSILLYNIWKLVISQYL